MDHNQECAKMMVHGQRISQPVKVHQETTQAHDFVYVAIYSTSLAKYCLYKTPHD